MSWFDNNKSKYKKKETPWGGGRYYDDDYADYSEGGGDHDSWGHGWGYSYYKPRYDMSISLETRVLQLIKTITGKSLKLVKTKGWGSDERFFYYNPEDLKDVSDNEVLGRIFHQLAKGMYQDKDRVFTQNESEPVYKELLNTLEDNRADTQLQVRYVGCRYYADELWDTRKFTDNPINKYNTQLTEEEYLDEMAAKLSFQPRISWVEEHHINYGGKEHATLYWKQSCRDGIANSKAQGMDIEDSVITKNPAWEFCFNVNALQNGESEWDFSDPDVLDNFEKAIPLIKQYLDAATFEEAQVVYPEIKKLYPVPTQDQQKQMEKHMPKSEGLSAAEMAQLNQQMEEQLQRAKGREMNARNAFGKEPAHVDMTPEKYRDLAAYKDALRQNAATISVLGKLLRSILQDNRTKRFMRPFKRGKIDGKSMYKYIATDNIRVFKKPKAISEKEYTMAIVVDQSGSMKGANGKYAMHAALVMAEVFEIIGLQYEILGFSNNVVVYKKFNESLQRDLLPSLSIDMGGTDDANALQVIKGHIKQFDPDNSYRKGVFVITDGNGSGANAMQDLIRVIEHDHNAKVYGIGIGDMDVRHLKECYINYLRVDNVKELPKALTELMRTQFRRN